MNSRRPSRFRRENIYNHGKFMVQIIVNKSSEVMQHLGTYVSDQMPEYRCSVSMRELGQRDSNSIWFPGTSTHVSFFLKCINGRLSLKNVRM